MATTAGQFDSVNHGSPEHALATSLINKLPRSIRGRVLDKTPLNTNLTPTQLMEILGQIVRKEFMLDSMIPVKEPAQDTVFNASHPKKRIKDKDRWKNHQGAQHGSFCGQLHFAHQCPTHSTPAQRIQAVRRLSLCFNCLSSNHSCAECPSRRNFRSCGDRHHSSLCKKLSSAEENPPGAPRPPAAIPQRVRHQGSSTKPSTPIPSHPAKNAGKLPHQPLLNTHFADLIPDSVPVEPSSESTFPALDTPSDGPEGGQESHHSEARGRLADFSTPTPPIISQKSSPKRELGSSLIPMATIEKGVTYKEILELSKEKWITGLQKLKYIYEWGYSAEQLISIVDERCKEQVRIQERLFDALDSLRSTYKEKSRYLPVRFIKQRFETQLVDGSETIFTHIINCHRKLAEKAASEFEEAYK